MIHKQMNDDGRTMMVGSPQTLFATMAVLGVLGVVVLYP